MRVQYRCPLVTLAALVAVAGVARPAAAQTVVAGPTTTDVTATAGERFTLPIAADLSGAGGAQLGSYRLSLRWKTSLMSFVSLSGGAFAAPTAYTDSTGQGVLKLAGANANGAGGLVTLANITFQVTSTAAADTFKLAFQEMSAAGTFTDLLPSLLVTSGVFCGGAVWGDLDNSGTVQALDAQIVLMHAVGLPVTGDTTRADVDGDTKINPRDALVILSRVVGLDVAQFRVGRFIVSACLGEAPKTLSIVPSPLALAAGDLFSARAEVRDSTGQLLAGKNLAWSSNNAAVATVDSTGKVTAVANGTATLTAAVTPGVTGTAAITVGDRHRWVVNPVVAQGKASEVGSDTYPFSTIKQAIDRASAGDTVAVGVATYTEPLSTTKRLVFLGDSTAAGLPVISRGDSVAGELTVSGQQVVRRLKVGSSRLGLVIRADSVDLSSFGVNATDGPALTILHSRRTALRGITVSTAAGAGIWVDSASGAVITIVRASVGGVGSLPVPLISGAEYGVYAAGMLLRADSVTIDSSVVAGITPAEHPDSTMLYAGVLTLNTQRTLVRATRVTDVAWPPVNGFNSNGPDGLGIAADSVGTLEARDSVIVLRVSGSAVAMRGDTLRVVGARLEDVGDEAVSAGDTYRVLDVSDVVSRRARRGVRGKLGDRASVRRSQFRGNLQDGISTGADTTLVDSVFVGVVDQTGYACGVVVDSNAAVTTISHSIFKFPGYSLGVCSRDPYTTGDVYAPESVGYVAIDNSVIDGPYTAVHVHADSLLMRWDSIQAIGWGIWQHGGAPRETQWLKARDLRIHGLLNQGIYADTALAVELVRVEVDSTQAYCAGCEGYAAIEVTRAAMVRVDSSLIRDNYAGAVRVAQSGSLAAYGNTLSSQYLGATFPYSTTPIPAAFLVDDVRSVILRRNNVDEMDNSAIAVVNANGDTVTIDTNTVRTARTAPNYSFSYEGIGAIRVQGVSGTEIDPYTTPDARVTIRGNTVKGTYYTPGYNAGDNTVSVSYLAGSALLEGNTADSVGRFGLLVQSSDSAIVHNNTVTRATAHGLGSAGYLWGSALGNAVTCSDGSTGNGIFGPYGYGEVLNNTISNCGNGILLFDLAHATTVAHIDSTEVVRGNTITGGTTRLGYGIYTASAHTQRRLELVANSITGTKVAGLYAIGDTSIAPRVRVDSNQVVSDSGVSVLVAARFDTARVRGNTVTGAGIGMQVSGRHATEVTNNVVSSAWYDGVLVFNVGATGAYALVNDNAITGGGRVGLRLLVSDSGGVFDSIQVVRNTLTGNGWHGLRVDTVAAALVRIDTNLIADNLESGILLKRPATGTLNSIRRNAVGISDSSVTGGSVFQANNIEGNGFGVRNVGSAALDAANSWWGDGKGPRCSSGCDTSSTGDSLSTNVTYAPVAADTVAGAPAGAPRQLGPVASAPRLAPSVAPAEPASQAAPLITAEDLGLIDPAGSLAPAKSAAGAPRPKTGAGGSGRAANAPAKPTPERVRVPLGERRKQ